MDRMNITSITEAIDKKRKLMNDAEINKQTLYDQECARLEAKSLEYITTITDMYNVIRSLEKNNFRFNMWRTSEVGSWKSHISVVPFIHDTGGKLKYAFTDGIYHRLGFFENNCNVIPRFGYEGGGVNKGDVYIENGRWNWTDHYDERKGYLYNFLSEIDEYIACFFQSVEQFVK